MRKQFWTDVLIATMLVFFIMWGILKVTQLNFFNSFDSIGTALNDVELTDYVFWKLRDYPTVDERIVLVNIGDLSRREIAEQINILSRYQPKVIGLDSFFDCPLGLRDTVNCPQLKDEFGNLMLAEAIRAAGNVVLVNKVEISDSLKNLDVVDQYDSLEQSDELFRLPAMAEGFANLDSDASFQDDVKTCRQFNPSIEMANSQVVDAFGVALARAYDSASVQQFLARGNEVEVINYRGNIVDFFEQNTKENRNLFYTLDVHDVLTENFTADAVKDKIVIMGYLGEVLGDPSWDDKFYTPLNNKMAGKANPDMFGAVIHANIVSMILNADYIDSMSEWQEMLMAFLICLLNVALFWIIFHHYPDWYDGLSKMIQAVEIILLTLLMVFTLHWFDYKMDVTLTLAAVALAGDSFEIYEGMVKRTFPKVWDWFARGPLSAMTFSKR